MNKAELVAQRHAANVERYGSPGATLVKYATNSPTAMKPPTEGFSPGPIETPRQAEQIAQYLGDFGNYPPGMSVCFVAGLNGDSPDRCLFAGTEHCTCDVDGAR